MRIALFTPFSPDTGGGAAQLRSILAELKTLDISWYYLAPKEAISYPGGRWLGPSLSPATVACDLLLRTGLLPGSTAAVRNLVKRMEADLYWVVAHNEGISVAAELHQMGKKVHLTVHDDPVAFFARSRKYWALQPVVAAVFARILRSAESVDVTSHGMRDFYKREHGIDSFPLYRYLPALPKLSEALPSRETLRIGHIGILYYAEPFRSFFRVCKLYAADNDRRLQFVRIGKSHEMDIVASEYPENFHHAGELNEKDAVTLLASCHFLYAMYPGGNRFRRFRQTSFPIKLTTYIQAQRPIFAHTPRDSTLASVVAKYGIGQVCSSESRPEILKSIDAVLKRSVSRSEFEAVQADILGSPEMIRNIQIALLHGSSEPPG